MSQSSKHSGNLQESLNRRHETSDVDFRRIMITGIGLLGLMVVGLLYSVAVSSFFSHIAVQPGAPVEVLVTPNPENLPPLPRLQPDPHAALVQLRNREDSVLTRFAWVSKDSALVQVPIERAMELVIDKKMLPSR